MSFPSFETSNTAFETWLRTQCDVVEADLVAKHKRMKENAFSFLRCTYFRWAETIEVLCPDLATAPSVLSVGDAHAENFGTWRDGEGRWIWGINDFDDAADIPYPFDLVRLVASSLLMPDNPIRRRRDIAEAILEGYKRGLKRPRPVFIDEGGAWMAPFATLTDKARTAFADEIDALATKTPPPDVAEALTSELPRGAVLERFTRRRKGGGSLGRPRYLAIATWQNGEALREAKALVPSGWDYAHHNPGRIRFLDLARGLYRAPDPFLTLEAGFIIRRIAVDSQKLRLRDAAQTVSRQLLEAQGADIGAIHAASGAGPLEAIRADLARRPEGWLHEAAKAAIVQVEADYKAWLR